MAAAVEPVLDAIEWKLWKKFIGKQKLTGVFHRHTFFLALARRSDTPSRPRPSRLALNSSCCASHMRSFSSLIIFLSRPLHEGFRSFCVPRRDNAGRAAGVGAVHSARKQVPTSKNNVYKNGTTDAITTAWKADLRDAEQGGSSREAHNPKGSA